MTPDLRLRAGLALLFSVIVVGTGGYVLIEDMAFVDAFYMTAITVSTVGFGEVGGELGDGGKVFTVGVIIFGMGGALYTAAVGIERGVDRLLGGVGKQRRMEGQIEQLTGHIVLCGFGRVGSKAWRELRASAVDVVVIEAGQEAAAAAREAGALVVEGDATYDDVLAEAGLDTARALIAAVRDDSDNLVITLSAKARRADILVIARVVEAENERKVYLAGADRVVAPQQVGAERLAALALHSRCTRSSPSSSTLSSAAARWSSAWLNSTWSMAPHWSASRCETSIFVTVSALWYSPSARRRVASVSIPTRMPSSGRGP